MPDTKLGEIKLRGFARLTYDDLFHLRDALIYAEHAHKSQPEKAKRDRVLFDKLGTIIREEQ